MSMINVSLVGNLTHAPERFAFAPDKVKVVFKVAVQLSARQSKPVQEAFGENTTEFYKVEAWGKLGELALKYLDKGNQVGVSGKLIMEHWLDKEGRERLTPLVAATQISLPQRSGRTSSPSDVTETEYYTGDSYRSVPPPQAADTMVVPTTAPTGVDVYHPPANSPVATSQFPAEQQSESFHTFAPTEEESELFMGAKVIQVSEPRSVYRPRSARR